MRISVELVPRSAAAVLRDAHFIKAQFKQITMLNIPDLLRFSLRSWEACAHTAAIFPYSIPHVRAIDISPHAPLPMVETLLNAGLAEVLVVGGDPPRDVEHVSYPQSSVDVIRRFKRDIPNLKVYGAIDPYRQGFRAERDYISRKLDAGADGFFTQPFFDLRLMEVFAELLGDEVVFWGFTPVTTDGARAYWETTNKTVFPRGFKPTMDWNRAFTRSALELVKSMKSNAYLMPIRVDLGEYLEGLV
jgi:methylenetetrahydrofolate reductase (NADPH)